MIDEASFRPCVGMMVVNPQGRIFVGSRLDMKSCYWQMPQGGMEPFEQPLDSVQRELEEETGIRNVSVLSTIDDWLHYQIPENLRKKLWNGRYKGQRQKWFLLGFQGKDEEIQLDRHKSVEFGAWKWLPLNEIVAQAVPFKREVYRKVVDKFTPNIETWVGHHNSFECLGE